MVTALINGKIIVTDKITSGVLVLENGLVKGISDSIPAGAEVIDCEGGLRQPRVH